MLSALPAVRNDVNRVQKPESNRITIAFDSDIHEQIRIIAKSKGIGIAPMLREWIGERLKLELQKAGLSAS